MSSVVLIAGTTLRYGRFDMKLRSVEKRRFIGTQSRDYSKDIVYTYCTPREQAATVSLAQKPRRIKIL